MKPTRLTLSDDDDEDHNNMKYSSENDEDEQNPVPMSTVAMELLKSEKVLKAAYLLKKGEKRRSWKKRWFILRTTKLAMYKDDREYKLLRIIDLHEIHKVVQVTSKDKYKCVFAIVTPKRTYYVQAMDQTEMDDWISQINHAKKELRLYDADDDCSSVDRDEDVPSNTQQHQQLRDKRLGHEKPSKITPLDIPTRRSSQVYQPNNSHPQYGVSSSSSVGTPLSEYSVGCNYPLSPTLDNNPHPIDGVASSEDDEEYSADKANYKAEENKNRVLIEGYLLKLGRIKGWRKRWFVLRTDSLSYYENDKEYSPHRIIPLSDIIDSLEISPISKSKQYCFKVITPKRNYILCTSTVNNLDSWLNALIVAVSRAKKEESALKSGSPVSPTQTNHKLPLISEKGRHKVTKIESTASSCDSIENTSHISGVSGAGGVGGAGGALGGAATSSGLVQVHSRPSERIGCAK
ncbi:hypothetical protein BDB01DRAFT_784119 [Pilobolus umbonatus]|nr:hypothetical protein BDB01DRAFT_784119 [Pilobolus umbonatus]